MNAEGTAKGKRPSIAAFLAWAFAGLFVASAFVNLITILSIQGFRNTLSQMHEPVYNYYQAKLDYIDKDFKTLSSAIADGKGKSPYQADERKLERAIAYARGLWERSLTQTGENWFTTYRKAGRATSQVDKLWTDYRKKLGLAPSSPSSEPSPR
jgi:hypothetical protein